MQIVVKSDQERMRTCNGLQLDMGGNVCLIEIEHSHNNVIMYFENEVGPGVFQLSVLQTYNLQNLHTTRTESTHIQLHVVCALGIPKMLVFIECWNESLQV